MEVRHCSPIPFSYLDIAPQDGCFKFLPVNVTIGPRSRFGFLDLVDLTITQTSERGPCELFENLALRIDETIFVVNQLTKEVHVFNQPIHHPTTEPIQFEELNHLQVFHDSVLNNRSEELLVLSLHPLSGGTWEPSIQVKDSSPSSTGRSPFDYGGDREKSERGS